VKTNVSDTSIDAYRQLPAVRMKNQCDRIFDVVKAAKYPDMSLREIAQAYEAANGIAIDISTVSARVNELIAAKRLERLQGSRPCRVSRKSVHAVRVPRKEQASLWN
jgi:hypothetical protein